MIAIEGSRADLFSQRKYWVKEEILCGSVRTVMHRDNLKGMVGDEIKH